MRKIKVISRKYDGTLRDEYEAFLYAEDKDTLRVYTPPGTMSFDHRKGSWESAPDGLLEIYFKEKWYTVWHICEQKSQLTLIYTHICMPAILTENTLAWVDLDLDYRVYLDGSMERLDEQDFERNSQGMQYSPEIIKQARIACEEVEWLFQSRAFPFNHQEQVAIYREIQAK
jgi:protein associated with RNAse G/E